MSIQSWIIELTIKRYIKKEALKMLKLLQGKKTYIVAGLFAVVAFLEHAGFLNKDLALEIIAFLNGAGFAALRASKK